MKTLTIITLLSCCLAASADFYRRGNEIMESDTDMPFVKKGWIRVVPGPAITNAPVIIDRLADPILAERYAAAWDLAQGAASYSATNATKLANIYAMAAAVARATNEAHRASIQADASRLDALEVALERQGGWQAWTSRYDTQAEMTVTETWLPAGEPTL